LVDSIKKVPELAIFLIENAHELFDHFEEDSGLLPSSAGSTQLHQSTDSGLSDDVGPHSESPNSALFDSSSPPLSDQGLSIEEVKVSQTEKQAVEPYQPLFSPRQRNTDPPANAQLAWSPSALTSPRRLIRHGAFRSGISSQSSLSSQEHSPEPIRVYRVPSSATASPRMERHTYVKDPEELRVSDLIISHRKKESTDSTKTLVARTDSMNSRLRVTSPPAAVEPIASTKFAAISRPVMSPKPTVRRALLSKQETLGLPPLINRDLSRSISSRFEATKPPLPPINPIMNNYRPTIQERQASVPFRPPRRSAPDLILGQKVSVVLLWLVKVVIVG
jgi:hypothetical protein